MGDGEHAKKRRTIHSIKTKREKNGTTIANTSEDSSSGTNATIASGNLNGAADIDSVVQNITNHATDIMRSIMNGDTKGVVDKVSSIFTEKLTILGDKVRTTLFGEKDVMEYSLTSAMVSLIWSTR